MLFKFSSVIAVFTLFATVSAVPAAIPAQEELIKKENHPNILRRQVIHCGYYEVCYCPRNGVRFTCRDPKGCSMTCYPS